MCSSAALSVLVATLALVGRAQDCATPLYTPRHFLLQQKTRRGFLYDTGAAAVRASTEHLFRMGRTGVPDVIFTHLLKAGGSTVEQVLHNFFGINTSGKAWSTTYVHQSRIFAMAPDVDRARAELEEVPSGFEGTMYKDLFRIGLVRSPCNYLLSMWAFHSTVQDDNRYGHAWWAKNCFVETHPGEDVRKYYAQNVSQIPATDDDKARFRSWVRASAGTRLHYLSYRSYIAAHHDPTAFKNDTAWDDGQFKACLGSLPQADEERIADALLKFDLHARYDCLLRTEALEKDLYQCLEKYIATIADPSTQTMLRQRFNSTVVGRENPTPKAACSEYFDNETTAFVWELEGTFAKKAGYTTCCA